MDRFATSKWGRPQLNAADAVSFSYHRTERENRRAGGRMSAVRRRNHRARFLRGWLCQSCDLWVAFAQNIQNRGRRQPMNRREFLKASGALPLAQAPFSNLARAQAAYPARNITMIVPFPAG